MLLVFHTCNSGTVEILLKHQQQPRVNCSISKNILHCIEFKILIPFNSSKIKSKVAKSYFTS